jgi:hypothetical protein
MCAYGKRVGCVAYLDDKPSAGGDGEAIVDDVVGAGSDRMGCGWIVGGTVGFGTIA